jgi:hypothetical protein
MATLTQAQHTLLQNTRHTVIRQLPQTSTKDWFTTMAASNPHEKNTTDGQHSSEKKTLVLTASLAGEICKACTDQVHHNWTTLHVFITCWLTS